VLYDGMNLKFKILDGLEFSERNLWLSQKISLV